MASLRDLFGSNAKSEINRNELLKMANDIEIGKTTISPLTRSVTYRPDSQAQISANLYTEPTYDDSGNAGTRIGVGGSVGYGPIAAYADTSGSLGAQLVLKNGISAWFDKDNGWLFGYERNFDDSGYNIQYSPQNKQINFGYSKKF